MTRKKQTPREAATEADEEQTDLDGLAEEVTEYTRAHRNDN
jgi:hypothetical protein